MVGTRSGKSSGRGGKDHGNNNPSKRRQQRKRGHPDSDATIIRLTPDEIMGGCMFVCEVCNEEFKREQNLILHATTHHVKLKLKRNIDKGLSPIRCKNAYPCPVTTCRHHDARYALTEISSIKKHYGRKHCAKEFACSHCTKKYALKGDLKAHEKRHLQDMDAESSKRPALFDDGTNSEEADASSDVANNSDNENNNDEGINIALGTGEQTDYYVPLFDAAPEQGDREQGQTTTDMNEFLDVDLDMMGSLPMGLTGLLKGCSSINDPKAPIDMENSTPINLQFTSGAPSPMVASANGCYDHIESTLSMANLKLSSSHGIHHSSNANDHGVRSHQSLFSTAVDEQYFPIHAPASRQWEEYSSGTIRTEPNANVDGLDMLHFVANYYFPTSISNKQTMSTANPSLSSFVPFFEGAMSVNTNNHSTAGGPSDGSNGLRVGSAKGPCDGSEQA